MSVANKVWGRVRDLLSSKWARRIGTSLLTFCVLLALFSLSFHEACKGAHKEEYPIQGKADLPEDLSDSLAKLPDYARPEASTYLTLPEWYTVFSYQEYGEFITTNPPSDFPYFTSIFQFWSAYCHSYGMSAQYSFNWENHLMLSVIGVSFSVEYALKSVYENIIGAYTESYIDYPTQEDAYAIEIAREYGAFIPYDPWYDFPFGEKTVGVWTETDLWGQSPLRKWERKFGMTLENGVKAGYAGIIRKGTGAVYGAPDPVDYLVVGNFSRKLVTNDYRIGIVKEEGEYAIITIPHYQGFTDIIPGLARKGVRFIEISGNNEIAISVVGRKGMKHEQVIWRGDIPTDGSMERVVVRVPVEKLQGAILKFEKKGARIEHIYDY